MTRIYLIRHAEAEGNLYRRAQGQYNSLITDRGVKQIEALSKRFEHIHIDAVYSSDLNRTEHTAEAIYKSHGLELNTDRRLREINVGIWEDQPWGNIWYSDKAQLRYFTSEPEKWDIPGGESFELLETRMAEAMSNIAQQWDGRTIAVFSHGMAIRTFLCYVTGTSLCDIASIAHSENTGVSCFVFENDRFSVEFMNDSSHLTPELKGMNTQGWWKNKEGIDRHELRFVPMDIKNEKKRYISCYREIWESLYGDLNGFGDGSNFWRAAVADSKKDRFAISDAYIGEDQVGFIELNLDNDEYGNIVFCYMRPEYRNLGMGIQLIGQSVSVARKYGKQRVRLNVSDKNIRAMNFYKKYGFKQVGVTQGSHGSLVVMEKNISNR